MVPVYFQIARAFEEAAESTQPKTNLTPYKLQMLQKARERDAAKKIQTASEIANDPNSPPLKLEFDK